MRRPDVPYKDAADLPSLLTKPAIDDWASKVAEHFGYSPNHPLIELVPRLGGHVRFGAPEDSPDGGTIYVHTTEDFDIILPQWTSPRRDQFTIAHEIGHYALHSKFGEIPLIATRTGSGRSEWEANWFAAGFLMPKVSFLKLADEGKSEASLAKYFRVSIDAARIRLKTLQEA